MHAHMEKRQTERNGPFDRDRAIAHLFERMQVDSRIDIVVIGNRNQRICPEFALDLTALQIERLTRR